MDWGRPLMLSFLSDTYQCVTLPTLVTLAVRGWSTHWDSSGSNIVLTLSPEILTRQHHSHPIIVWGKLRKG